MRLWFWLISISGLFIFVLASEIEDEIEEYSLLTAGLSLTESIIKNNSQIITSIAKSKGYNPKAYGKKLSAMMLNKFLSSVNKETVRSIVNDIQTGIINSTFIKYVEVDYQNINEVSFTEEEKKVWSRLENMLKAEQKIKDYFNDLQKKEIKSWEDFIKDNMKLITIIAVIIIGLITYACNFCK